MSAQKRRSRLLGLFGRQAHSQDSVTTLNTAAISATASTAGASAVASATSANVSGSENSAAALRNLQNASQELNTYLGEAAKDVSLVNILDKNRWLDKVQACPNSSFASRGLPEATVDEPQRRLMKLAASSAIRAYKKPGPADRRCNDFDALGEALEIDPDRLGGSIKAATVELFIRRGSSDKVLVVAIRGSFIVHDWMVNLNDGAESPVQDDFMGADGNGNLYAAHSGFLACSKTMKDAVLDNVYRLYSMHFGSRTAAAASSSSKPTLLFTGHSAGGAVAAMLYAHFVNSRVVSGNMAQSLTLKNAFSSTHCITFGAPPITTVPLVPSDPRSLCLSVANDGDPVPRADGRYINTLLKLFTGPMPKSTPDYVLPSRTFFNAGRVLVLLPDGSLLSPNESGPGSLAETVMGDKSMHSMNKYWRRMQF